MKIFAFIAFCLCLAMSSVQAQNATELSNTTQTTITPEQQVRSFMQYMIKTYNITGDQQLSVKKAGTALIGKVSAMGNINARQKAALVNEFNATIMGVLQQQKEHYQQASSTSNPMIEAIINAAVSK